MVVENMYIFYSPMYTHLSAFFALYLGNRSLSPIIFRTVALNIILMSIILLLFVTLIAHSFGLREKYNETTQVSLESKLQLAEETISDLEGHIYRLTERIITLEQALTNSLVANFRNRRKSIKNIAHRAKRSIQVFPSENSGTIGKENKEKKKQYHACVSILPEDDSVDAKHNANEFVKHDSKNEKYPPDPIIREYLPDTLADARIYIEKLKQLGNTWAYDSKAKADIKTIISNQQQLENLYNDKNRGKRMPDSLDLSHAYWLRLPEEKLKQWKAQETVEDLLSNIGTQSNKDVLIIPIEKDFIEKKHHDSQVKASALLENSN